MEKTLQHEEAAQCFGLPPTGSRNHHSIRPEAGHALTFKLDLSKGAGQIFTIRNDKTQQKERQELVGYIWR
jgi:hypothetical protein